MCLVFLRTFSDFLSTTRAFYKVVPLEGLTTLIPFFLSITFTLQFKFSNSCYLTTMQDINKSFGGVIDLCVYDFCEFFQIFVSNVRAFSKISLIHCFHKIHNLRFSVATAMLKYT